VERSRAAHHGDMTSTSNKQIVEDFITALHASRGVELRSRQETAAAVPENSRRHWSGAKAAQVNTRTNGPTSAIRGDELTHKPAHLGAPRCVCGR